MLTLTEASKLIQNPLQRGVVETFARTSPVLERLPFMDVNGNAYSYNVEQTLPGIAFRDYNASYTESTGVVNPHTEKLYIMGGISSVDRALVKTQGSVNNIRAIHDNMKAKAAALTFTAKFFNGDNTTAATEFDGLKERLTGGQALTYTGAMTLEKVDELIDGVIGGPTALFMSKATRRTVNALRRAAGQATEVVSDSFGRQIDAYAGIPIGVIEEDKDGAAILADGEIYAIRMGVQEYVSGLQAGGMEVIDLGLNRTQYETLIEWICGIAVFHPKAAARLHSA
ncbi:major capsid protein [Desulfovibrio desulfuricans]|uniref:major capsid protein n=1 Tax=Desulfovibrio desulfuricans TaxID=876 RepID=UPI001AEAFB7B|nr:hypothetical protein [Desulfovibrio desulfuricans]QTO41320.1 hypothetical protein J8J02_05335 [Desulfovibrio desulfuricans]